MSRKSVLVFRERPPDRLARLQAGTGRATSTHVPTEQRRGAIVQEDTPLATSNLLQALAGERPMATVG